MLLNVAYPFLPKRRSLRTSFVMDHFGVDFDQGEHVVARNVELDVRRGDVALFNGPSGSGKSSLLRAAAEQLQSQATVLWIDRLELPDLPLVDAMPAPVQASLELLAACGLSEAQLLLRTPAELSDGQRYRFRLAMALALAIPRRPAFLVADEFSAALDRTLARVLACNLRRFASRSGIGFLLATTHEDIADDLAPDLHVRCDLDGQMSVVRRPSPAGEGNGPRTTEHGPQRAVSFFASSGSARAPDPTGRTSLGGITAATTSGRSSA